MKDEAASGGKAGAAWLRPARSLEERIERAIAGCSAALYASLIVYLVVLGLRTDADVVAFEITTATPERRGGMTFLDFEVVNSGTRTVADVHVAMSGNAEGAGEVVFDYVPAGSARRGAIMIPDALLADIPRIVVTSYRDP